MSYTLKGRLESRVAAALLPLLIACIVGAVVGSWWPLQIGAVMLGVGLALDAALYDRIFLYQPGWVALPLGVLELGLVTGIAHVAGIDAPVLGALGFYAGSWLLAQTLGHAGFPLWRLSYAEDGGELGQRAAPALAFLGAAILAGGTGAAIAQQPPGVVTPMFDDVTGFAGLATVLPPSACGEFAAGAAAGDVNGDGDVDLFLPGRGDAAQLFIGNGSGYFVDQAEAAGVASVGTMPAGASLADYDNDGRPDLFVFGDRGNRLFHNVGNGFVDVTVGSGLEGGGNATSAAWADFDGDGRLDVFVTYYGRCGPFGISSFSYGKSLLYRNDGSGRFTDVTYLLERGAGKTDGAGFQAAWFDYNDDGRPDLYLGNDTLGEHPEPNHLWRNDGKGPDGEWRFTDVSAESRTGYRMNTMGIGIGDYNRDLRLDLALSNMEPNRLLRNEGDGTFDDVAETAHVGSPMMGGMMGHAMGDMMEHSSTEGGVMAMGAMPTTWGTAFYDFNLDGWEDLYFAAGSMDNPVAMANQLFVNRGNGRFADLSMESGAADQSTSRGVAFVDYDRDGRMDMYVVNQGAMPRLFHNVTPYDRTHWLEIDTVGTVSNRDGCGARVVARVDGAELLREVMCGSTSFASWSDPTLHFGLGEHDTVSELRIRWPSGRTQVLRDVPADRLLRIEEPRR